MGFGEKIKNLKVSVTRIIEWNFHGVQGKNALAYIFDDSINQKSILMDFFCTTTSIGKYLAECGFFNEKKLNNAHIHTQKIGYIFKMEKKINNKNYFNLLYW
mgnify:CR=1 FL=1